MFEYYLESRSRQHSLGMSLVLLSTPNNTPCFYSRNVANLVIQSATPIVADLHSEHVPPDVLHEAPYLLCPNTIGTIKLHVGGADQRLVGGVII